MWLQAVKTTHSHAAARRVHNTDRHVIAFVGEVQDTLIPRDSPNDFNFPKIRGVHLKNLPFHFPIWSAHIPPPLTWSLSSLPCNTPDLKAVSVQLCCFAFWMNT